ncbi:Os07g0569166 [Oryza sativa Japonica Group]|uniref:Os07g0569166 protein n=2 Tax=Oryza sativa subsp. japonica TaxID=39947 RepID=C7J4Y8_ORYSJ|nr:hypothetical protein EE612_040120 [Oryza sativa]BAH93992.1 Os07g0569166 [Oryza sativa Japonica Group]BAT02217.1 Os07g0569166 [Oryza sativa Japonica Group]|eukprot:NP_001175264.1 Os07g0569166 [Oryza sativa Japonica Group]
MMDFVLVSCFTSYFLSQALAFSTWSPSQPLMTTSSRLKRLLTLATSAICHAAILDSTSSFFTCPTDTSSPWPPPADDTSPGAGSARWARRGDGMGLLSGTMASGFVSSSSSSPILPSASSTPARLESPPFAAAAAAALALAAAATMAENSLLIVGKSSLGAVSLPTERIDVCLLPAADSHDSLLRRWYDDDGWLGVGVGGGLSAWMSLNSGSSSSSSTTTSSSLSSPPLLLTTISRPVLMTISRSSAPRLLLLLPLAAVCSLNMCRRRG